MEKVQAEKEIDYRIAMSIVKSLVNQGILTDNEMSIIRNRLIDEIQPFIGSRNDFLSITLPAFSFQPHRNNIINRQNLLRF